MADQVTYSFLAFMKSIFHFCLGCYCGRYSQNGRSNLSSFNSLWPSDTQTIWCHWSWSTLIQVMACRLFCAKPLPNLMLIYCQLTPWGTYFNRFLFEIPVSFQENKFENVICKVKTILLKPQRVNSLWPSDTMWGHTYESTLAQVMACCLMAPSHYLNQCWLIINRVKWHSPDGNFIRNTSTTVH